MERDAEHV